MYPFFLALHSGLRWLVVLFVLIAIGTHLNGWLRLAALLEGISFLILLGIAMPLKYIWGQPWLVSNVGMIHGLLFILYVIYVIQAKVELGWPLGKTLLALLASFIPFGTFYVMAKIAPAMKG